ncbi:MAG: chorismate mutase [Alphaproteobacteria bacterium]|tara:strand:+ start:545 stop:835 length:291 start_codon:yes stop_codon:yes gene_type:complete
MDKTENIKRIREQIDLIDLEMLNLLSKRKDLVTEIVKFKSRDQIIDKKRIKLILDKLDLEAKKRGIPENLVRNLWEGMIKSFISYEEDIFENEQKK